MASSLRPSPPALAVLGVLEIGPLHPYGIQRLIQAWGKDQVINVGQRAGVYNMIRRLHEAGLIAVSKTERDQAYPERTVYELTGEGRTTVRAWLTDLLSAPRNEFPGFPAALSFVMILGPEQARTLLEQRAAALRGTLTRLRADLARHAPGLPRVTLLDDEYTIALTAAELAWVDGVIEDLRSGALAWSDDLFELARAEQARALSPARPPEETGPGAPG